jgi:hypothetical protein
MYRVKFPGLSPLIKESQCENNYSHDKYPEDPKVCMNFLETSDFPIAVPLTIDPLSKKYNGMPVSEFLNEVQDLASSLGYIQPSDDPM